MNTVDMIEVIDGFLAELGTSGLVDARKARDQLMDLRLMLMSDLEPPAAPLVVDPDMIFELPRP